jgi:fructose-bisphosphate aldolase / 6-deoxy-5-ketofructose 1-phosphate synthase
MKIFIPADVPQSKFETYKNNFNAITKQTDHLFLFAADQKIEHLNDDFYGPDLPCDIDTPEHLFTIAEYEFAGAMATHLGLIARYGMKYNALNYIVKLNGKTNLIPTQMADPLSLELWTVDDVVSFKNESGLNICGIGYTLYLGSEHEAAMLHEAAQAVFEAHQEGLIAILWIYPRAQHVTEPQSGHLIAGAAGVAANLGADFVKIQQPLASQGKTSAQWLHVAVHAAGNTKIIVSGGSKQKPNQLLRTIYDNLHIGGVAGCAIGRNIFQQSVEDAALLSKQIAQMVYEGKNIEDVLSIKAE